jgi:hypothetical protein
MTATAGYLFEGADWDFSKLQRIHDACEEIARSEPGLDTYPNQIEVITAEQMLDVDVALALSAHRGRPEVISARLQNDAFDPTRTLPPARVASRDQGELGLFRRRRWSRVAGRFHRVRLFAPL